MKIHPRNASVRCPKTRLVISFLVLIFYIYKPRNTICASRRQQEILGSIDLYNKIKKECCNTTTKWLCLFPITQINTRDRLLASKSSTHSGPHRGPSALAKYTGIHRQTYGNLHERKDSLALNAPLPMHFDPHILRMMFPQSSTSLPPHFADPRPSPLTSYNSHGLGYKATNQFSSQHHPHDTQLVPHGLNAFVKATE